LRKRAYFSDRWVNSWSEWLQIFCEMQECVCRCKCVLGWIKMVCVH
jgi:hypothetical protein